MKKNNVITVVLGIIMILIIIVLSNKNSTSKVAANKISSTDNQISLSTDPNPLRMGPANFIITIKNDKGDPVSNATVNFDLNMTMMNMGTQQGTATSQGDGRYVATGRLTMQGPWRVTTKITMPDGQVINKSFTVKVQ